MLHQWALAPQVTCYVVSPWPPTIALESRGEYDSFMWPRSTYDGNVGKNFCTGRKAQRRTRSQNDDVLLREYNRPTSSNPRTRNTLQVNGQRGVICSNACRSVHEGPWFGVLLLPEVGSTNKWRCLTKSPSSSSNLTTFIHPSKCSFSSPLWFCPQT